MYEPQEIVQDRTGSLHLTWPVFTAMNKIETESVCWPSGGSSARHTYILIYIHTYTDRQTDRYKHTYIQSSGRSPILGKASSRKLKRSTEQQSRLSSISRASWGAKYSDLSPLFSVRVPVFRRSAPSSRLVTDSYMQSQPSCSTDQARTKRIPAMHPHGPARTVFPGSEPPRRAQTRTQIRGSMQILYNPPRAQAEKARSRTLNARISSPNPSFSLGMSCGPSALRDVPPGLLLPERLPL